MIESIFEMPEDYEGLKKQLELILYEDKSFTNIKKAVNLQWLISTLRFDCSNRFFTEEKIKEVYYLLKQVTDYLKGSRYEAIALKRPDKFKNNIAELKRIEGEMRRNLKRDMKWYNIHVSEIEQKYKGMHIAVGNEQVAGASNLDDLDKLVKEKGMKISFTNYIPEDNEYTCFSTYYQNVEK